MKPKKLTTSVIVPVYNEEDYIPRFLQSIRESSVQPDEILFCDNNSTDGSVAAIRAHGQKLPVRILHENIKGITRTTERLWRNAGGDLVLKVDADSRLPRHWIRNAIRHFTDDPDLMGCTGAIRAADGALIHTLLLNTGYVMSMPIYRVLRGHPLLFGPNTAVRRSALEKINGYVWHTDGLDDQIISQKLADAGMKIKVFRDMYMYHSTRRYNAGIRAYIEVVLAFINPRYYTVKS